MCSSDYRDIDPKYGTLDDWDNLLQGIHKRGMKLMCVYPRYVGIHCIEILLPCTLFLAVEHRMDLVVNHTSDEVTAHCPVCLARVLIT